MEKVTCIFKYFWTKLMITIPTSFLILSNDHYAIIWGLVLIVMIDTFLGIWVSIRHKVFASYKLGRIASKISKYFLAMASMWVLTCVSPTVLGWTFHGLGVFLILTEVFSNFEKLAILGFDIPTKFLSKLNKDFSKYYYGDKKESRNAIKRILNKQQANADD